MNRSGNLPLLEPGYSKIELADEKVIVRLKDRVKKKSRKIMRDSLYRRSSQEDKSDPETNDDGSRKEAVDLKVVLQF